MKISTAIGCLAALAGLAASPCAAAAHLFEVATTRDLEVSYQSGGGSVKARIKSGTRLGLTALAGDSLQVRFASHTISIPASATNYEEARKTWRGVGPEEFFAAAKGGYLVPGMTRDQVSAIWGPPSSQAMESGVDEWRYPIFAEREVETSRMEVSRGVPGKQFFMPGRTYIHGNCIVQEPGYTVPFPLGESVVVSQSKPVQAKVGDTVVRFGADGLLSGVSDEYQRESRSRR